WGLDANRLVNLEFSLALFDHFLAFDHRSRPGASVLPGAPPREYKLTSRFHRTAQAFDRSNPGHTGKKAPADRERDEQDQRGAGKAGCLDQPAADHVAEYAAGCHRQRHFQGMQAQCLETGTRQEEDYKAATDDENRAAVRVGNLLDAA